MRGCCAVYISLSTAQHTCVLSVLHILGLCLAASAEGINTREIFPLWLLQKLRGPARARSSCSSFARFEHCLLTTAVRDPVHTHSHNQRHAFACAQGAVFFCFVLSWCQEARMYEAGSFNRVVGHPASTCSTFWCCSDFQRWAAAVHVHHRTFMHAACIYCTRVFASYLPPAWWLASCMGQQLSPLISTPPSSGLRHTYPHTRGSLILQWKVVCNPSSGG